MRLRAFLRALERQMLEKVGGAVGAVCLGARAGIDPDADGRRLSIGGVLGGDLFAISWWCLLVFYSLVAYREAVAERGAFDGG